ncbi:hypothetical protein [Novosphingobium sp. Leaf2]|uniref:hypothetical protein n=1 Tax=Novosphingobium sp. Leaf2 TaxID=1735670 RepID=UPI0006F89454|nr:hypothetical protein [Novosphingobium sp. Leaf2]KQM14751.1 hypothetical protein ASE49_11300 [Novosphingobium sp. Leaf2]
MPPNVLPSLASMLSGRKGVRLIVDSQLDFVAPGGSPLDHAAVLRAPCRHAVTIAPTAAFAAAPRQATLQSEDVP